MPKRTLAEQRLNDETVGFNVVDGGTGLLLSSFCFSAGKNCWVGQVVGVWDVVGGTIIEAMGVGRGSGKGARENHRPQQSRKVAGMERC